MGERERNQFGGPGGIDTFLGKDTKITGKLVFAGAGRIDGHIEGEISAQDVLTIGEGAVVNAKISANSVVIEGRVTGDVTVSQRLELRASARLQGNITAQSLVVHEGAVLEGKCSMGGSEAKVHREKAEVPPPLTPERRERDTPAPVAAAAAR